MRREINIKNYLPPFLLEFDELDKLLEAENEQIQLVEDTHWMQVDNRFIQTCNEDGVARFEKILGIVPLDNDTLNDRRFRVLSKWNRELPYNYVYLRDQLITLCGEKGYKIELDGYNLTIWLELTSKNMFIDVEKLVDEIIPCNLVRDIRLLYNQHLTLAKFTHEQLAQWTQWELRNEPLMIGE